MVIITNRWSPDTCGCELEYTWDNEQNENQRVHNFAKIVKACDAHKDVVPPTTRDTKQFKKVYDTVLEENQRKNQALTKTLEARPELADIIDNVTGKRYDLVTVAKQMKAESPQKAAADLGAGTTLKEGINYTWKWIEPKAKLGQPRTLEIDFETSATLEDIVAAKSVNPNASQIEVQQATRQRVVGQPDKLQQVLDAAFTKTKGRGKVKVKGIAAVSS